MKYKIEITLAVVEKRHYNALAEIFDSEGKYLAMHDYSTEWSTKAVTCHSVLQRALSDVAKRGGKVIDVAVNFYPLYADLSEPRLYLPLSVKTFEKMKSLGITLDEVKLVPKFIR